MGPSGRGEPPRWTRAGGEAGGRGSRRAVVCHHRRRPDAADLERRRAAAADRRHPRATTCVLGDLRRRSGARSGRRCRCGLAVESAERRGPGGAAAPSGKRSSDRAPARWPGPLDRRSRRHDQADEAPPASRALIRRPWSSRARDRDHSRWPRRVQRRAGWRGAAVGHPHRAGGANVWRRGAGRCGDGAGDRGR